MKSLKAGEQVPALLEVELSPSPGYPGTWWAAAAAGPRAPVRSPQGTRGTPPAVAQTCPRRLPRTSSVAGLDFPVTSL